MSSCDIELISEGYELQVKLSLDYACISSIAACCGRLGGAYCPKKRHGGACHLLNRNG